MSNEKFPPAIDVQERYWNFFIASDCIIGNLPILITYLLCRRCKFVHDTLGRIIVSIQYLIQIIITETKNCYWQS